MNQAGQAVSGNLWRYKALAVLGFTPFMLPVIVLFWQDCGLAMLQIFWLQTFFAIAVVLLEVPTGMVADRLGKRTSLLLGMLIVFCGVVGYALSRTFVAFLVVEIVLALGLAFYSGADTALLYDTLKVLGRDDEFKRIEGEATALRMLSFAVCNLAGGVIGDWSLVGAIWASALGPFLAFFVVMGFVEVQPRDAQESLRDALRGYGELLRQALKFVRKHQYVRWQILFFSVLSGSSTWLLWLYQPYMSQSGLDVWAFGGAFAIFNLCAAFCSKYADNLEVRLGDWRTNLFFGVLQVLPLVLMASFIGPMSFLFILGHQAVRGFMRPIINHRILQYTFADKRATVLSLNSMGGRLFFALTGPLVGWVSETQSMTVSLHAQAVGLLLLSIGLGWMYVHIPKKYFKAKSHPT
jgi:MFS family permease